MVSIITQVSKNFNARDKIIKKIKRKTEAVTEKSSMKKLF